LIVRNLEELRDTPRDVRSDGWRSLRLLLASDRMGFSFHISQIEAGAELTMHYTNHVESVYCIRGEGSVENCANGKRYPITPGSLYALDQNDRHVLRADSELTLACVFCPPLHGQETHDASGAYPVGPAAS
jgi:L-ectoine synthase